MGSDNLLYIYNYRSATPAPDDSIFQLDRLLIEPVWTNILGWTRGYFVNVGHLEITPNMLPEKHCFWRVIQKKYINEHREILPRRYDPWGEWGLVSYRAIDGRISDALGIARVPIADEDRKWFEDRGYTINAMNRPVSPDGVPAGAITGPIPAFPRLNEQTAKPT